MELSVESCQYVTLKVRDFFELPSEIGYSLNSPEFRFADDTYCLRLYPNGRQRYKDEAQTEIELKYRDNYVPGGTLTALCCIHLKEQSSAGSHQSEEAKSCDTKEEQKGLTGQFVCFSSRSWSFKMELSVESPCQNVTWKVPDFFHLLSKIGHSLSSPEFRFADDRYCLRFYPKGNNTGDTVDADLQLVRMTSTFPERIVLYKVGCRWRNKNKCEIDEYTYSGALIGDFGFCLSRSQLEKERDKYFQDCTLTIVCSMRLKEQSSAGSPQSEKAGNCHSEEKQEGLTGKKFVTCAVQTDDPDSTSCAIHTEVADIVVDKKTYRDLERSSHDTKGVAVLSERMKQLLIKGEDHDVTICVQNKEFRAHRSILKARSPVFAMMFAHDTKENNTGTISIEDCDPDSFEEFLLYVYSGRTENLTPDRALQVYYPADKYDFPELKERCVSLLKSSLSVESFCDVVLLAAKHQEKKLLEVATGFFMRYMKKIVVTVSWQKFLAQNPVEANELIIKSTEILYPKD